jgi:hypothetical protein
MEGAPALLQVEEGRGGALLQVEERRGAIQGPVVQLRSGEDSGGGVDPGAMVGAARIRGAVTHSREKGGDGRRQVQREGGAREAGGGQGRRSTR